MFNVKKAGQGFMDTVLLAEHRDEFTKVHLAKLLHEGDLKAKKLIKNFADKVYADLLTAEQKAAVKKPAFTKDFVDGVQEWAELWVSREFPRRLEQYEIGLEVCVHNTQVLVDEVLPAIKDKLTEKFNKLISTCAE